MDDGISLAIGGTAAGSLVTLGAAWIKARCSKTKIEPDPLNVRTEKVGPYVTVGECKQHRCAIEGRIGDMKEGFKKVLDKLDENDRRSETRATAIHTRIDPLVSQTAANKASIEILKEKVK